MKKSLSLITALAISSLSADMMHIEWSQEFRVPEMNSSVNSIMQLENGEVVVVGQLNGNELLPEEGTPPSTPDLQSFIMKFDNQGNELWSQTFGQDILPDNTISVIPSQIDNGLYVVGSTVTKDSSLDIAISKFEENGSKAWQTIVGTSGREFPTSVVFDKNGSIYIAGVTDGNFSDPNSTEIDDSVNNDNYSTFIVKVDSDGVLDKVKQYEDKFWYGTSYGGSSKISIKLNGIDEIDVFVKTENSVDMLDENLDLIQTVPYQSYSSAFDFKLENNGSTSLFFVNGSDLIKLSIDDNGSYSETSSPVTETAGTIYSNPALSYDFGTDSVYISGTTSNPDGNLELFVSKIDTSSMKRVAYAGFGQPAGDDATNYSTTISSVFVGEEGELFIGGMLSDMSLIMPDMNETDENNDDNESDDDIPPLPKGSGAFIAKIVDDYVNLPLVEGWNLVSGNIALDTLPEDIKVVYKFGMNDPQMCNDNGDEQACKREWQVFSPDAKFNNQLHELSGLGEINEITVKDGIWIFSESNLTISAGYNDTNFTLPHFSDNWSLNGSSMPINPIDIMCENGNDFDKTVWTFKDNHWSVATPDPDFLPTLDRIDTIEPNVGFWVDCKMPLPFGGFPDIALRSCVNIQLQHLEDNETYVPTFEELEEIYSLDCSNQGIVDIAGVDTLVNVADLNLSDNNITDLAPLFKLEGGELTTLILTGNSELNSTQIDDLNETFDGELNITF